VDFDFKIAGATAGIAFILSFLIGLISGSTIGMIFIRALVFGIVFFVLGALISVLYQKALSDAQSGENPPLSVPESGVHVDLSVGEEEESADDGAISDESQKNTVLKTQSEGLEQNNEIAYNPKGQDFAPAVPAEARADGGIDMDMGDFIPGMPGMERAGAEAPAASVARPELLGTVEMSVGDKPQRDVQLSDFGKDADGKKIAGAIQTMLNKDEG
jgi:cytoskeletal protein RodZ